MPGLFPFQRLDRFAKVVMHGLLEFGLRVGPQAPEAELQPKDSHTLVSAVVSVFASTDHVVGLTCVERPCECCCITISKSRTKAIAICWREGCFSASDEKDQRASLCEVGDDSTLCSPRWPQTACTMPLSLSVCADKTALNSESIPCRMVIAPRSLSAKSIDAAATREEGGSKLQTCMSSCKVSLSTAKLRSHSVRSFSIASAARQLDELSDSRSVGTQASRVLQPYRYPLRDLQMH